MKQKPVIYQLIPRLYANFCPSPVPNGTIEQNGSGKLNAFTDTILSDIKSLGATHVWYTGVIRHAHKSDYSAFGLKPNNPHVVKGNAGSPYAITDYYDIDPDLAEDIDNRMDEFASLVKRTHDAGLKVIIDFVPNHVAREYHSVAKPDGVDDLGQTDNVDMFFSPQNNFYYIPRQQFSPHVDLGHDDDAYIEFPAKASGNDCFTASPGVNDWYDTAKLNYGVDPWNDSHHFNPIPPTWHKMLHILKFWASKGVDGFRCDMAHMVPIEFWHWAISDIKAEFPDIIFIAEIYDIGLYRPFIHAGFDYLYDKVNLYDTLRAIECNNVSAARLTSCWQTVDGIGANMLNFLENHDEQRFASPQYAGDPLKVIPSLVVSSLFNVGPMMIYAGQELGEPAADAEGYSGLDGRTTIFDYWSIPSLRQYLNGGRCNGKLPADIAKLHKKYQRILAICNDEIAARQGRFFDLMYANYHNPGIDPHRHFAFLRYDSGELLVIVVNFSDKDAEIRVNIPEHAFSALGIPHGRVPMVDLLGSSRAVAKDLFVDRPFVTKVRAHGAVAWKAVFPDLARHNESVEK